MDVDLDIYWADGVCRYLGDQMGFWKKSPTKNVALPVKILHNFYGDTKWPKISDSSLIYKKISKVSLFKNNVIKNSKDFYFFA
jgi:hypothetical protein